MKEKSPAKEHAGIHFPPPLIYILYFFGGMLIQKYLPFSNSVFMSDIIKYAGVFIMISALAVMLVSVAIFKKNKTAVFPFRPSTSLQTSGTYRFSRNPMYLGFAFVYFGATLVFGNWWNIVLFPLVILTVQEFVIKREEKYLEKTFGQSYSEYMQRVRRWL